MKRISLFCYDYAPNDGGISRLCSAIVAELAQRGRDVFVITLRAAARAGTTRPSVLTMDLPRRRWLREAAAWIRMVRLRRGTVVLSGLWNPEGTLACLAGCSDKLVMAHGNEVMRYPHGWRGAIKARMRSHVLSSARAVICNSQYTARLVAAISPGARTIVLTPGVDSLRFAPLADKSAPRRRFGIPVDLKIILSVSRIDSYKGHNLVLTALSRLPAESRERLHYVAAGRGGHLLALQRMTAELGLQGCVTWLGFVGDDDLPALYGSADLFVLCSREDLEVRGVEGFGMAFLEAQAAGVPVIGTRAGGIPDAVEHNRGGWLIEPGDVIALGAHFARLAADDKSFKVQGLRARSRALNEGSWQCYVTALLHIIDRTT